MSLLIFLSSLAMAAYPAEIRTEFVKSCVNAGGANDYCTCTIDTLEQNVTLKAFEDGSRSLQLGNPDATFQTQLAKAASLCLTPQMYRSQFVPACTQKGASKRYCDCNLDFLMGSLGFKRLIDLSFDIQMGKRSNEFANAAENAAVKCAQPAEYQSVFMAECTTAGATSEVCSCMHDYYVKTLGFEKLVRLDSRMHNGLKATEFEAIQPGAQAECLKK